jgi:ubiquinone/menaquinone biosynthesis C-methylase UbiE
MMKTANSVKERVKKEKEAHEERDVLAESYRLKNKFSHIWGYPSRKRLENALSTFTSNLSGKTILDYGCGRGEAGLEYLSHGATVFGIDIASNYVSAAHEAAKMAGYPESQYSFEVMDAHELRYPDNTFDFVVGHGILHHLNPDVALNEIYRVLKPGGRVLMYEPLAGNPLLKIFRLITPNARTVDERPFTANDIKTLCGNEKWRSEAVYCGLLEAPVAMLTSIIMRNNPDNWLIRAADKIETWVQKKNLLNSWNQYILFNMVKQ